jgi:hypothetical protein
LLEQKQHGGMTHLQLKFVSFHLPRTPRLKRYKNTFAQTLDFKIDALKI